MNRLSTLAEFGAIDETANGVLDKAALILTGRKTVIIRGAAEPNDAAFSGKLRSGPIRQVPIIRTGFLRFPMQLVLKKRPQA